LNALGAVFPDVRAEVFREMLSSVSETSRLQIVTESLLKNKAQYVQGRWRVPEQDSQARNHAVSNELPPDERFRTAPYISAVKATLYQEFQGLSHSTIKAVLAEHNYSYVHTRNALVALSQQSWRYSLTRILYRRRIFAPDQPPFIEWRVVPNGAKLPLLISTRCAELDHELQQFYLAPILTERLKAQISSDRELAEKLNEEEAEHANATFDCECCFTASAFEHITVCDDGEHYICARCIRHTVTEAVYGQGWARSIDSNRTLLRCVAPSSNNGAECQGCIPSESLYRALSSESGGSDILAKFEERLAAESIAKARLPLLKCPFCVYAEFEDVATQQPAKPTRRQQSTLTFIAVFIVGLCLLDLCLDINSAKVASIVSVMFLATWQRFLMPESNSSIDLPDPDQRHHGRKFTCRNPACSRLSCLTCLAPWVDVHICYQSSRQALRTYVESAVTEAIKRTCPQCNLAFVKSAGCNKLICVCGYTMCYVCRGEIGTEGYAHFCQHFRPVLGQQCQECNKCDLYRVEDEDVVIQRAKDKAVKEWKERENASQAQANGATGWNAEEEADGVGLTVVSRRNASWL